MWPDRDHPNDGSLPELKGVAEWNGHELVVREDLNRKFPLRIAPPEKAVPYLQAVVEPLVHTLEHAAGLQPHLLVGYGANFEFWWSEVRHALTLIDGYDDRFRRFEDAQLALAESQEWGSLPEVERSVSDSLRRELRRQVVAAATKFFKRCDKEKLIASGTAHAAIASLG